MSFHENIFNSSCEVDGYIPISKVESIWIQGLQSEVSKVIVTENYGSQYEATWRNASQTSINIYGLALGLSKSFGIELVYV